VYTLKGVHYWAAKLKWDMKLRFKYGQSILSFVFVFIVLAALAIGITRIWAWFTINYGVRQVRYQETRTTAAHPDSYGTSGDQYLRHRPITGYQPIDLTEDWVFSGQTPEQINWTLPEIPGFVNADAECQEECPDCVETIIDPDTGEEIHNVIPNCLCYMQCMCEHNLQPRIEMYNDQIQSLRDSAAQMRSEAHDLEEQAEDCDDPWEICWWGGFGMPAKKLRQAAKNLRREAENLCCGWCNHCNGCTGCVEGSQADMVATIRDSVLACCDQENPETYEHDRDLCLDEVIMSQCDTMRDGRISMWDTMIDDINHEIDFANEIADEIARRVVNPLSGVDGCNKWAYYGCRYNICEPQCEPDCNEDCLSQCEDQCGGNQTCFDQCVAQHCGPSGDWYGECLNGCMDECVNTCIGTPEWEDFLQECCQSFCCREDAEGNDYCNFGVFDRRYHGYTETCIHFGDYCCPAGGFMGGSWVFPGELGDGCILTWFSRYPEWSNDDIYLSWCGAAGEGNQSHWWQRACFEPDDICDSDDDCETPNPPPECEQKCGLSKFRLDQLDYINQILIPERAKYQCKQTAVQDCCNALWTEIPGDEEPPETVCCYQTYTFNPEDMGCTPTDENIIYCKSGLTHSECVLSCMNDAANVGEEEPGGIPEECQQQCAGIEDPFELGQCIQECLGINDCCTQWCTNPNHVPDPEDYQDCIEDCTDNPDGGEYGDYGC
jgi:hypothetical protein